MKRTINFLLLTLFLWSCDDGDMSVTTFNFTSQNLSKCQNNSYIYNVNQNEVLLLDIPVNNFVNIEETRVYTLGSADKLVYRLYSAPVNNSVLCADFPVSEPQVVDEWIALAGATIDRKSVV